MSNYKYLWGGSLLFLSEGNNIFSSICKVLLYTITTSQYFYSKVEKENSMINSDEYCAFDNINVEVRSRFV